MIYKVDNKDIWMEVSQKLYSLMKQGETTTTHLFGVETDSTGSNYISLDLEAYCPIFLTSETEQILTDLGNILGIEDGEGAAIKEYILTTNPIQLKYIVPTGLTPYTPIYNAII